MKCCQNCINYVDDCCWKDINNMDESLLDRERDAREPEDTCDDWEYNEFAD